MIRFACWLCLLVLAVSGAEAQAEARKLWSYRLPDRMAATQLRLLPERNLALAAVGNLERAAVELFDLRSGQSIGSLTPPARGPARPLTISGLAANSRHIAVLASDGYGTPREFVLFVYDAGSRALLHRIELPPQHPKHVPSISDADALLVSGNHLLLRTGLRDKVDDSDPLMLQFDLESGMFVRAIGLAEIDPKAPKGWFGPRAKSPDFFFASALVADGILYAAPMAQEKPAPTTVLTFDLEKGAPGPSLPTVDRPGHFTTLVAVRGDDLVYVLQPPSATERNVVQVGTAIRLDRQGGDVRATYADPFAPDGQMSLETFIGKQAATGRRPFAGSWFPEALSLSGEFVVASAPNAPVGNVQGAGALTVFDAQTGKLASVIVPEAPGPAFHFGRLFAHAGDLVLVSTLNNLVMPDGSEPPQDLILYRVEGGPKR